MLSYPIDGRVFVVRTEDGLVIKLAARLHQDGGA